MKTRRMLAQRRRDRGVKKKKKDFLRVLGARFSAASERSNRAHTADTKKNTTEVTGDGAKSCSQLAGTRLPAYIPKLLARASRASNEPPESV